MLRGSFRVAAMLVLALGVAAAGLQAKEVSELKFPKLNEIRIPKVETVTLKNGVVLMMVEDHELPLVKMKALVRAGTVYEPKDRRGLAELMGETWRTGGTASRSGDEIDEILESMGSSVESSVDETAATLTANTLTENFERTLAVFVDIMTKPAFSEDKIELAKTHMRSAIARRNDEPMGILMREYPKLVYGEDSPYARQVEYEDVDRLTRKLLLDFHEKYFRPNAVILGVWGDFKTSEMKRKLERAFTGWNPAKIDYPAVQEVDMTLAPSVNYIEKTDIEQSFIIMGHLCMRLDDPDYPAFYIMSDILGASWGSRIFNKVRTEKGLAYAAGGGLLAQFDHPGPFYAFASTKFASTHEVVETMLGEVRRITESEVEDSELERAKDSYLNSFAFQFDSVGKILQRLMTYRFFGYPDDFLQRTRAAVEKVTKEDVLSAAKRRLRPDDLIILAVGDASQFDKPLSSFGNVSPIDITIPEPEELIPEATQASAEKGQQIVEEAIAAMGGSERLLSVERMTSSFKASLNTPSGEFAVDAKIVLVFPDRLRLDIQTPMGEVTQVLNKDKGWMASPQGIMDLQGSQIEELRKQAQFDPINVLRLLASGKATAQYVGDIDLEGKTVFDVLVTLEEGAILHMYVDPADHRVVGNMRRTTTNEGPADVTEIFSDFRDVDGVMVNFASVQRTPQKRISSVTTTEVKMNPTVDLDVFEKPSE